MTSAIRSEVSMGHPLGNLFADFAFRPVRMKRLDRLVNLISGKAPHAERPLESFSRSHRAVNLDQIFVQPLQSYVPLVHRPKYTDFLPANQCMYRGLPPGLFLSLSYKTAVQLFMGKLFYKKVKHFAQYCDLNLHLTIPQKYIKIDP